MHGEANVNIDNFRNFGRSPVPEDLCKDKVPGLIWFWRIKVLKVFIMYGHGSHLGQWTATISAIFHSPNLRRLHIELEQQWPRGLMQRRSRLKFSTCFPYICMVPIQMHMQTLIM